MIQFTSYTRVIVPALTDDTRAPYSIERQLKDVTEEIGGYTSTQAIGAWSDGNTIIEDTNTIYEFGHNELTFIQRLRLKDLVKAVFKNGKQQAVTIQTPAGMFILEDYKEFDLITY
jgi:hypothetical protein